MERTNFTVVRVARRNRTAAGMSERHNERKNEEYSNENIDLERSALNIQFTTTGNQTYNERLNELVENGSISTRSLSNDSEFFDELLFDVNTEYFEMRGGYDFAKKFYEHANCFVEELYGKEYIISSVMHADEINIAVSEKYGHTAYHYHLHVMALPVVDKEIFWTQRTKDVEKRGKVKAVIKQINHSEKWKRIPKMDKNGVPILGKNGKQVWEYSYTALQDKFYEYMVNKGYCDILRGERGSTREHLAVIQYQIEQDKKRLLELTENIEYIKADIDTIKGIGKENLFGQIKMSKENFELLKGLATEGIASREKIKKLEERVKWYKSRYHSIKEELQNLKTKCAPFLQALEVLPDKISGYLNEVLENHQKEKVVDVKPERKQKYKEISLTDRKKSKVYDDLER